MLSQWSKVLIDKRQEIERLATWASINGEGKVRDYLRMASHELAMEIERLNPPYPNDAPAGQSEPCPDCHGCGKLPRFSIKHGLRHVPCPDCNGTGKIAPVVRTTDTTGAEVVDTGLTATGSDETQF